MSTAIFVLALLVSSVLLSMGMLTPQRWLFAVGGVILVLAFIVGINPERREDRSAHRGH